MSPVWRQRTKRIARWLTIAAAAPFVVVYVAQAIFLLAGLAVPFLDGGEARNILREWRETPEFRAIDHKLERVLAEKWRASQSVSLTEIIDEPMKRACLATWVHWRKEAPAWELAWRSDRPVWWRTFTGNSTVMVEFETGVVRAFRTKYHGHPLLGGGAIRFQPPLYSGHTCAGGGRLTFVPANLGWLGAFAFHVRGD